jgi:hypothetical protein
MNHDSIIKNWQGMPQERFERISRDEIREDLLEAFDVEVRRRANLSPVMPSESNECRAEKSANLEDISLAKAGMELNDFQIADLKQQLDPDYRSRDVPIFLSLLSYLVCLLVIAVTIAIFSGHLSFDAFESCSTFEWTRFVLGLTCFVLAVPAVLGLIVPWENFFCGGYMTKQEKDELFIYGTCGPLFLLFAISLSFPGIDGWDWWYSLAGLSFSVGAFFAYRKLYKLWRLGIRVANMKITVANNLLLKSAQEAVALLCPYASKNTVPLQYNFFKK